MIEGKAIEKVLPHLLCKGRPIVLALSLASFFSSLCFGCFLFISLYGRKSSDAALLRFRIGSSICKV